MKRSVIVLIFCLSLTAKAADVKNLLDEANKAYSAQDFPRAQELYEQILGTGKESAQVYYNLGNTFYKQGDNLRAVLNYERAWRLSPGNEEIDFNLKIANQFVIDNIEELPKPFFTRWWGNLANRASADTWAKWSVTAFILFLVLLGSYFFSRILRVRRLAFYTAVVAAGFVLVSFSLASRQYRVKTDRSSALIYCPRVTAKSAPSSSGTDLFMVHEGLKVKITDTLDKWREIQLSDGNKGWVADSCLIRI